MKEFQNVEKPLFPRPIRNGLKYGGLATTDAGIADESYRTLVQGKRDYPKSRSCCTWPAGCRWV